MEIQGDNFCTVKPVDVCFCPEYRIIECKETIDIHIAVPGFCRDELKVVLFNGILTVSGKEPHFYNKNHECKESGNLNAGCFTLSFETHCVDCVDSVYLLNGILVVRLNKINPDGVYIHIRYPSPTNVNDTNEC